MESVADRYHHFLAEVKKIAEGCGRNRSDIKIVAVSKGHEWEAVKDAYEAGCRDFGENRVQEAESKRLEAPSNINWHLIGTLQKNKVRKVLHHYDCIHSVDSFELAEKISFCSLEEELKTVILLQVNTSGEASKHGLSPEEWETHLDQVMSLRGIDIQGFMTMAPLTSDDVLIRKCFRSLRLFKDKWNHKLGKNQCCQLSMGMSHDYRIAIEEGATLLRIGTALFG